MKYCGNCGSTVNLLIPDGDNLPRHVCTECGMIHYQNPKIVAGCIPEWQSQILLCRRAIEPRLGLWTIPAGFMENGETLQQAAQRETYEEACADVDIKGLYSIFNLPHVNQIYIIFRGQLKEKEFAPGLESLETALFEQDQIPWAEMAFPAVIKTLERYFEDRKTNQYPTFIDTISRKKI
ncbi:MAG: NUDIX hydrolase [Acidiferrobacteraceae bacterium]|nr:NUDIX hydrolase [Acidiferrobacteraceae bacterium]|tara:strand:+ start:59 stop:598 length:540 start_codon:yes stop_codon:yes gene_type:complete